MTITEQIAEIEAAHAKRRARGKAVSRQGVEALERLRLRATYTQDHSSPLEAGDDSPGRALRMALAARSRPSPAVALERESRRAGAGPRLGRFPMLAALAMMSAIAPPIRR